MKFLYYILFISLIILISNVPLCFGQSKTSEKLIVAAQIKHLKDQLLKDTQKVNINVAVLPFETTGGRSEARDLGEAAAILLNQVLTTEKGVTVVERSRLKEILEEVSLSLTGLISEEIKVGELLKADYLIAGAVADLSARFLLAARLVEVKSGTVVSSSSIEIPAVHFMSVSQNLVQVKRYPMTAAFRSMILPGWGQFYNEQPGKGTFVFGTELLLAAGTVSSYILYKQSKDAYERTTQRDIASEKYNEMDKYSKINWCCLGLMGAVWLYSVIDSYLEARAQIRQYKSKRGGMSFNYSPLIDNEKIEFIVVVEF